MDRQLSTIIVQTQKDEKISKNKDRVLNQLILVKSQQSTSHLQQEQIYEKPKLTRQTADSSESIESMASQ